MQESAKAIVRLSVQHCVPVVQWKNGQSRIVLFSCAPSQFFWPAVGPAGVRGPAAAFLLARKGCSLCRAVCRCESCPASPRHCRSGSARQERGRAPCTTNAVSSSKGSLLLSPSWVQEKRQQQLLQSAVRLPTYEKKRVCTHVSVWWERTAPPVRIFHSHLSSLFFKGFSDSEIKSMWTRKEVFRWEQVLNSHQLLSLHPPSCLLDPGSKVLTAVPGALCSPAAGLAWAVEFTVCVTEPSVSL